LNNEGATSVPVALTAFNGDGQAQLNPLMIVDDRDLSTGKKIKEALLVGYPKNSYNK
jgi:hypothetical protein